MGVVLDDLNLDCDTKIYEMSAHGAFFRYLGKRFNDLTTSEYFDSITPGLMHKGVLCQDVHQLTFADETFDVITSTEVFEHVADDQKGFREVCRTIKPGGIFVFTVPLTMKPVTVERAKEEDGRIVHIEEPTYGGDHLRKEGILDFRNYGMDIVERLTTAGFSKTDIKAVSRPEIGIPMKHVIVATK
jgi:SAM-dependent methyltransferase